MNRINIAICSVLLYAAACSGSSSKEEEAPPAPQPEILEAQQMAINRGQNIAEQACASCHAVGETGESPHAEAPTFRTIGQKYPLEYLQEALVEGIMVGHPDMPVWELVSEDADGLIAYMESIQVK